MKKLNILIIPGDGIGQEVCEWGKTVLETVFKNNSIEHSFEYGLIGHAGILATGSPLPDETLERARTADAILLGAVGHASYDNDPSAKIRPEQGLLKIRKELNLYANIRPIVLFDELLHASSIKPEILKGADILFFRELTGDVYFGQPRERRDNGNVAVDTMIYSKDEVRRIARKAYQAAMKRSKKVTSVDKANVLESSRLWRETVNEISAEFPEVETEHMFVDTAAMKLIYKPTAFDVVLTGNLFGDILTDEASQIAGSMGMLASASVGDTNGLYEPIHGAAHDITGKNLANPIATILSAALMLEISFDMKQEAEKIREAVKNTLAEGYRTGDIADKSSSSEKIVGTKEMGAVIVSNLEKIYQIVPANQ